MSEIKPAIITDDDKKFLTGDNFAEIRARGADYEVTVDELRGVSPETFARFKEYLKTQDAAKLSQDARTGFDALITEVEKNPVVSSIASPGVVPAPISTKKKYKEENIPELKTSENNGKIDIPEHAESARSAAGRWIAKSKNSWDEFGGGDEYENEFRRSLTSTFAKYTPLFSVDGLDSTKNIINYSNTDINGMIDSLEQQASNNNPYIEIGGEKIPCSLDEKKKIINDILVDFNNSIRDEADSGVRDIGMAIGVGIAFMLMWKIAKKLYHKAVWAKEFVDDVRGMLSKGKNFFEARKARKATALAAQSNTTSSMTPEATSVAEAPKTPVEVARQKAVLDSMYKQYLPRATPPAMNLNEFKIEALDPGTVTNTEYRYRLEKVTKLHNELMNTRDPVLGQDLRGDIEKVLSGENNKGFFRKMKDKGFDMVENTKRNLSGKGRLSKWNFPSLSQAEGTDIMRTMSQEIAADQKKLKTFRDLLSDFNSKVEDIKTEYEALGSTEKEILKTEKDVRIAEGETRIKTEITDKITKAKTVDEVKMIQEKAKELRYTDLENTALKAQADNRILVIENLIKSDMKSGIERAKTIEVVERLLVEAKAPALNFTPAEMAALQVEANTKIISLTEQAFSRAKTAIEAATEKAEVQRIFTEANALTEITDVQRTELLTKNREKIAEIDALEKAVAEAATAKEVKLAEINAKATTAAAKATAAGKSGSGVNLTVNTGTPGDSMVSTTNKSPTKPSVKSSTKTDIISVKDLSRVGDAKIQAIQDLMEVAGGKGQNVAQVLETMYMKLGVDPAYSCSKEIGKLENIFGNTTITGISADDWKIIAKDEVLYTRVIKDVVARPRLSSIEYKTKSIEVSERIKIEPGKNAEGFFVKFLKSLVENIKKPK